MSIMLLLETIVTAGVQGLCNWNCKKQKGQRPRFSS